MIRDGQHTVIARIRRGKYVRIPPEWRGQVADRQTIRKRESKRHHRNRRRKTKGAFRLMTLPRIELGTRAFSGPRSTDELESRKR